MSEPNLLLDSHGRTIRDLRVSITDRCDFRCLYCNVERASSSSAHAKEPSTIPHSSPGLSSASLLGERLTRDQLLSFEEIERIVRLAVGLGVQKIRLTGGEPLLRQQVEKLVEPLARIAGIEDLAMTTNGMTFRAKAILLRQAGLQRITFSLDSLERTNFERITGRDGLAEVLAAIALAQELGFNPVKANAVIIRGVNDHEIEALADYARTHGLRLRFIEFMPLDSAHLWTPEQVVPGREILQRLQARFTLHPIPSECPSDTARRWLFNDDQFRDPQGEIGLITSVSQPFCQHCARLRLTADGKLRTCLFSDVEHDLRSRLRSGASDDELRDYLRDVALQKEPSHRVGQPGFTSPTRTMCCIGG